ncbi:hypothetical protein EJ04DRAFT_575455 [Polyplosphaeria fusca]|uniref:Uncharacterized protein n=1 Tax=Polyplosphaeria fusca TaxID=682080 RepID=A0A9P4R3M9_9PLEO|nr:hypothetical protein EJ04DRAFT_575455 [Polyplosphaeria fusca]
MPGPATRSLEMMVLNAHRAKGVRYPTASQKDCFKTWYSYALKRGEVVKTPSKTIQEHGKHLQEVREAGPGGRTYLYGWMW